MGCSQSAAYDKITQHPRFGEWMEKFAALQISKQEALKLYTVFHRADLDGGGSINLLELLTVVDLERTPFTKRVFSIFDDDESGEIDFGEFVLALWNYCTLSKVSLAIFAFDLYDRDSTGILESHDLENMLKDIYGKAAGSSHYAKQVAKELAELEAKGDVGLDQFLEFTRTHHSLLWPAFQMQLALKKKMIGIGFWQTHAERRVKLTKNKYVKIKDLLQLHAKGQLDTLETVLVPQTQVILDNMGTKADRQRMKQQKALEPIFEGKSKKEQEFLKNYITGDYKMAAAMSAKQATIPKSAKLNVATNSPPLKPPAETDLSGNSGGGGGSADSYDSTKFPSLSVEGGSVISKSEKKKSIIITAGNSTTANNQLLQTVLEDIQSKEQFEIAAEEKLKAQQSKLKHGVKPAQDMTQVQQQQQQKRANVLTQSMKMAGMDAQVIQHAAQNTMDPRGPIVLAAAGSIKSPPHLTAFSSPLSPNASAPSSTTAGGSKINTRASWFGPSMSSTKVTPAAAATSESAPTAAAHNNIISPRTKAVASPTAGLVPPNAFASVNADSTNLGATPIDPVALLLSPSSKTPANPTQINFNNVNTGNNDRRPLRSVASAGTVLQTSNQSVTGAKDVADTQNNTTSIMANHKRRAQRRASVS